jgi:lipoprotein-anchoring transpeptidase ErfK/SrfK
VTYRPKEYWPAGVKVNVAANLRGIETEPDLFVLDNKAVAFDIGSSFVAVVDAASHQMTVKRDGAVVQTIPITTGKPGWDTRSGIKVIMSKERQVVMDASTLGVDKEDPEYYRLDVDYALRLTSSGEFVHAAPWSVASQGRENVSHGCVGMSTNNAAWFYNNAKIGDVVQVVNTGRQQNAGNGITVWNVAWETWRAGSALAGAPA